jgi:5'-methylthioadenosine phosphorylase
MDAVAAVLGSAFGRETRDELQLAPVEIETPWGRQTLFRTEREDRPAYVLFRHGMPHRWLPNQIPYRAQAWALRQIGCGALLVTSSVGVLSPQIPLNRLLLVSDVLTLDNRLPDGSACTMFESPDPEHGHLVLSHGLISADLSAQLRRLSTEQEHPIAGEVVFGYAGGPRSKTRAENRMWARLGAEVNSMTLAPEIVLANELEIPTAGLVVGHKYSLPTDDAPDRRGVDASLVQARAAQKDVVLAFLECGQPAPYRNHLYRYRESIT